MKSCIAILLAARAICSFASPEDIPVTDAPEASADDIRFVVMADRTGGMQPGVFAEAIEKANLLHPEFVISIGDLIDGYTEDIVLLDAQWKELDGMVEAIDMPFYYIPGNHDISNPWMEEEWRRRLGRTYYHFIHKGALFIALDTEDAGKINISPEQTAYFEKVLAENEDVRWTFVFMHRPFWSYENKHGFEGIEAALEDRRYTLFSGHHHNYFYSDKSGNERMILATSGGGSNLNGSEFGEFHHISHIALSKDSPKIAHIALDGFVPKDIVNEDNRSLVETIRRGEFFDMSKNVAEHVLVKEHQGQLHFTNPNNSPLMVQGSFPEVEGASFIPKDFTATIEPLSNETLEFKLLPTEGETLNLDALGEIKVETTGTYETDARALTLSTVKKWTYDWLRNLGKRKTAPMIDGKIDDWSNNEWITLDPPGYIKEDWDWTGLEDSTVRFSLFENEKNLFMALEAVDDRIIFQDGPLSDSFTVFLDVDGTVSEVEIRPANDGSFKLNTEIKGVNAAQTTDGHLLRIELAIPKKSIAIKKSSEAIRLNLRYLDHDRTENQKPSRLYWKPIWNSDQDYTDSGLFLRK